MRNHAMIKQHTSIKHKMVGSNDGGEYVWNTFEQNFVKNGIQTMLTELRDPHQNRFAERENHPIYGPVRFKVHQI